MSQNHKYSHTISYEGQAVFTIVHYPFAFKFLWAGLVDSFYLARFGRRKSWLFPIQMLLAAFMFYISSSIQSLLESKSVFAIGPVSESHSKWLVTTSHF